MNDASDSIRTPVVAGRFYESDPQRCAADAESMCAETTTIRLPAKLVGGVVPHAGWACSGRIAGLTWRTLAEHSNAKTVFLTGSVHTVNLPCPALDTHDAWQTPLGEIPVDTELRHAISQLEGYEVFDAAHTHEHALEVELPMLRHVFGDDARFVPCMIPPIPEAIGWGEALGKLLGDWHEDVLVVASSDLTHYGPGYGYTPEGSGESGYRWAHETNDRAWLDRVEHMRAVDSLVHADRHRSACGGGAVAAVIAAAGRMGATAGHTLDHTDSARELAKLGHGDRTDSVGYASIVFG